MDKYISNLISEFKNFAFEDISNYSEEEKILFLYAYYHYFNGDSSKISDLLQGNTFVKGSQDQITGIYVDQESDNEDVDVVVVICEKDFEFPSLLKIFKDTEAAIFAAKENKPEARELLNAFFREEEYKFSDVKPLKIRLITDFNPKSVVQKRVILDTLQRIKPLHDNVSYNISFGLDIEYEILEVENPREYVDSAVIEVDAPQNFVHFGTEQSIIVNLSALSLKKLYEQFGYRGLFAQNLRYYVKNAKIDGNIIETIREHSENFWYYNNGIILICDDYVIDGASILLKRFSIINGGQTTKLIGETDFMKDFYVQCKIIKNKYESDGEKLDFIANVAEASNTQKPIKDKDLIANKIEQRLLKRQLAEVGVYCQIKRGEKINRKLYPAAWQNTTNEELGQFLLSFVYQKPGTARGGKATICGNKERYSLLFGKRYDSCFLVDLLRIKAYYKLWVNQIKKTDDGSDEFKIGLVNNGMFFMTAIIGVICKIYYRREILTQITSSVISEQKMEVVAQHDIDHTIFAEDDGQKFFALFNYCYKKFYRPGYQFLRSFKERYNNYSNFTKINNNYSTYVFRQIEFEYRTGIPEEDLRFLSNVLYHPTEIELQRDKALLGKYVNVVYSDIATVSDVPENVSMEIKEALVAYRTKTYKLHRVKAYEVFKNVACDRIARFAPKSLEELKSLRCLDEAQITLYGQDILDIIKQYS